MRRSNSGFQSSIVLLLSFLLLSGGFYKPVMAYDWNANKKKVEIEKKDSVDESYDEATVPDPVNSNNNGEATPSNPTNPMDELNSMDALSNSNGFSDSVAQSLSNSDSSFMVYMGLPPPAALQLMDEIAVLDPKEITNDKTYIIIRGEEKIDESFLVKNKVAFEKNSC